MIGIYQDSFLDYLKYNLGDKIKITSKNIVVPCPWCEVGKDKPHYHMYISIEAPIFHCFKASCEKSGVLGKMLKHIEGHDISDKFVDEVTLKEAAKKRFVFSSKKEEKPQVKIPELKPKKFSGKEFYIRNRLKFANYSSSRIKGLVYDINEFIKINNIPVEERIFRVQDYLQSNFVGFVTENNNQMILRNIDESHTFRYFKIRIHDSFFIDYYKLPGNNKNSKRIVLSEGIFDIFTEHIFDSLNLKNDVALYASVLSSKYISLIRSIIFHEQIFNPEVIILSDNGIEKDEYQKMKKYNKHIINNLIVYYNTAGGDFNDTPIIPAKFLL